ncbi:glycosyltransferase family 4 protein [Arcticibacter eurypsychrophilus]|uniref:glycosyltransferase family 4 protein n=1 Tax=Arcticibacter eurypsychrophilus TaxID=1434752 RepID=UPI00084D2302|nr:glycosyltransferase [Arcticibacter eurypsychrophilus]
MNILIVALEFPYPAIHGARVDILNRIQAFRAAGHKIFLLTWHGVRLGDLASSDDIEYVKKIVDVLILFEIKRGLSRYINLFRYPFSVSSRKINSQDFTTIIKQAPDFNPDFVFIDSIYGAQIGLKIARELMLPVCVRLHNIEHMYMLGQLKISKSFITKLKVLASSVHLKSFEIDVLKKSDCFFDISLDDLAFWNSKGFNHGSWLPPSIGVGHTSAYLQTTIDTEYDICFIGNLSTPNNINGIMWFVNDVLPIVRNRFKSIKTLIMGSSPSEELVNVLGNIKGITVLKNPISIAEYLDASKILINPVKFGSGVNIKSVDMLMRDNEVVTTTIGIKGLPKEISEVFHVHDTAMDFGNAIIKILENESNKSSIIRNNIKRYFYEDNIKIVTDAMSQIKNSKVGKYVNHN